MRNKVDFEWEIIKEVPDVSTTQRVQVFGGWLVSVVFSSGKQVMMTTTFVPDGEHRWTITPPVKEQKVIEKPIDDLDFKPM